MLCVPSYSKLVNMAIVYMNPLSCKHAFGEVTAQSVIKYLSQEWTKGYL